MYLDCPPRGHTSTPLQNAFMFIMNYIQQVCWSYYDVMGGQVVFFEIVAKNLGSRLPYDTELILLFSVLQPIKTHIHVS